MSDVETVAQAIWGADDLGPAVWDMTPATRSRYLRMAQCAITMLQLKPEWAALNKAGGNEIPYFPHRTREGAEKHAQTAVSNHEGLKSHLPKSSEAPDMGVVSRLVSPWIELTA